MLMLVVVVVLMLFLTVMVVVMMVLVFLPVFVVVMMVMVVVMLMLVHRMRRAVEDIRVVACLFPTADGHAHVRALDAAARHALLGDRNTGKTDAVELFQKRLRVGHKLEKRGGEHIARSAHIALQIKSFHRFDSFLPKKGIRTKTRMPSGTDFVKAHALPAHAFFWIHYIV